MFSTVNRLPAGSPTFKMTANVLPPSTPVALTSLVCVWDDPVFSSPPVIAGDNPPGQAPDPITSAEPLQPTQPVSVGFFWIVRTMLDVPIPPPLPVATPSNTKDAFSEPANIRAQRNTTAGHALRSIPVIVIVVLAILQRLPNTSNLRSYQNLSWIA